MIFLTYSNEIRWKNINFVQFSCMKMLYNVKYHIQIYYLRKIAFMWTFLQLFSWINFFEVTTFTLKLTITIVNELFTYLELNLHILYDTKCLNPRANTTGTGQHRSQPAKVIWGPTDHHLPRHARTGTSMWPVGIGPLLVCACRCRASNTDTDH